MMDFTCETVARAALSEPTRREGAELLYRCPHPERHANGDAHPSLKVNPKKDTWACFVCGTKGTAWGLAALFAGCDPGNKPKVAGWLKERGLFPEVDAGPRRSTPKIIATYDYADENGGLLFQVVRSEPKGFRQRRPDGHGGWTWNLDGTRRVLYRLREVLAEKDMVVICEGEKDVDTARKMGIIATCNPGGAGKWRQEFSEQFCGKRIAIVADADEPGRKHAKVVAASLHMRAESVKMLELRDSKDFADWVERGGTKDKLLELIRNAPEWKPTTQTENTGGFVLTRLGDLLAKPDTPVDWVLQNTLIAGGVSGVFAKPKVGKSTFCRNLCLAVARGGDFLGLKTKQGECIYLALEEREDDIRNDFRSMGADGSESIYVHAASAPADGIDALCDLVRLRRPVFVVIDPLFRLARIRDEKAYAETYAALGPLIDVAREVGTHVLLSHHAGKGMKSDAVDSPLGSTAIGGAVSTLVVLKRNESMRTIQTVQRVGADLPETVLCFELETHRLTLGGTRFEADRQECEESILDFLRDREPQTQAQIREGVLGKTVAVRGALTELVRSSRITRSGDGAKGKPFLYTFENSGSPYISRTREPESQIGAETSINTSGILVPENSQKSFLVPDNAEQPGSDALADITRSREQEFVEGKL